MKQILRSRISGSQPFNVRCVKKPGESEPCDLAGSPSNHYASGWPSSKHSKDDVNAETCRKQESRVVRKHREQKGSRGQQHRAGRVPRKGPFHKVGAGCREHSINGYWRRSADNPIMVGRKVTRSKPTQATV